MTTRRFAILLAGVGLLALLVRVAYPAADPPWCPSVGVVWHDEGAWVHNARNKALFGAWRLDEWNPVFIAPVFTGLEYVSFELFGVGIRQARLVSELAGVISVLLLGLGVRRIAGELAGISAAGLLATNYVYVMYDRAAIMEALMVALIVASWYCVTRATRGVSGAQDAAPYWGAAAGVLAVLAFFTKAAAAFFIVALGLAALAALLRPALSRVEGPPTQGEAQIDRAAAIWTLVGLLVATAAILSIFVLPHWADYRFYNWQMSVTRKPSYDLHSIFIRLSWFPVLHDTFSRMWFELCLGILGAWGILLRWRSSSTTERLLLLWVAIGSVELLVHDVGNERRYVFLIPAFIALTAILLGRRAGLLPAEAARLPRSRLLIYSPAIFYSAYVICGPIGRLPFLYTVRPSVRLSAVLAVALGAAIIAAWPSVRRFMTVGTWSATTAAVLTLALMGRDLIEFGQWAAGRTYKNYEASRALARVLPPDTLVQGKLANGLALENRIRPVFIGHEFGNYADRKRRDDVRYILTYTEPYIGFEGSQILDVLDAYRARRIVMTFDVAETPSGHDRAALVDKFGAAQTPAVHETGRARD
jgi:4-amino-4-deoxy-L-arabinose transferase-like glycosyltransferase